MGDDYVIISINNPCAMFPLIFPSKEQAGRRWRQLNEKLHTKEYGVVKWQELTHTKGRLTTK